MSRGDFSGLPEVIETLLRGVEPDAEYQAGFRRSFLLLGAGNGKNANHCAE
jgi:hypothetical protein